jgi:hypothetical protein
MCDEASVVEASRLALLAVALMFGCGARSDLPCALAPSMAEGCVAAERKDGDPDSGPVADVCNRAFESAPPCEGTGQIWVSTDECIDDGGTNEGGDLLEVYCVNNIARFCLSHEACPWRAGGTTSDEVTCGASGLSGGYMANTVGGCMAWEAHDLFCCSPEGRIGLAKN